MKFYAYKNGVEILIHDTEVDNMAKYDKIDAAEVARQRRADIVARKSLTPKNACHYCGHSIGHGQLWCSSLCATDHANEKDSVLLSAPVSSSTLAQEPSE